MLWSKIYKYIVINKKKNFKLLKFKMPKYNYDFNSIVETIKMISK